MIKREQTPEEHMAALGYDFARERFEMWERVYGPDRLIFTGDGVNLGLTYRDEGFVVVWSDGPTCVLIPPAGPAIVARILKGRQRLNGLVQRLYKDPGSIFQDVIDDYVAAQASEEAA